MNGDDHFTKGKFGLFVIHSENSITNIWVVRAIGFGPAWGILI